MQIVYKALIYLGFGILWVALKSLETTIPPEQSRQSRIAQMSNMRGVKFTPMEYPFVVTFRDSTTKKVRSAIFTDSVTRRSFIVLVDTKYKKNSDTNRYKRIYPSQTLSLACWLTVNQGRVQGRPTDSCWVFKAIKGRLTVYSYQVNFVGIMFDPSMIIGIQLNDGPLLPFNKENLKAMVGQNTKALELIEEKKYIEAIKRFNRDSKKEEKEEHKKL